MITLRIEESYLDKFMRALRSVAKKVAKSGGTCTWEEKEPSFEEIVIDGKTYIFKIHTFEVEGLSSYENWKVIAQIEHLPEGNVIKEFTDTKVPEIYRSRPGICDHCGVDRQRKITYIVENTKEGTFAQLGRSCVSLYTGCIQLLDGVLPLLSLEEYDVDHMDADHLVIDSMQFYLPVESVVAWSLACIEKYGYAKTRTEDGERNSLSTYRRVLDNMEDYSTKRDFEPQEAHYERFPEILEWVSEHSEDNTFFSNVCVLLRGEYVSQKNAAYIVGAVGAFLRDKAFENKVNDSFVGEIGDKVAFDIEEISVLSSFKSIYGPCYVYRIVDTDGHVFTTMTSRSLDINSLKKAQGTVKEHMTAKGEKRTVLTRIKFS